MSRHTELYYEPEGSEQVKCLIDGIFLDTDHTDLIPRQHYQELLARKISVNRGGFKSRPRDCDIRPDISNKRGVI